MVSDAEKYKEEDEQAAKRIAAKSELHHLFKHPPGLNAYTIHLSLPYRRSRGLRFQLEEVSVACILEKQSTSTVVFAS